LTDATILPLGAGLIRMAGWGVWASFCAGNNGKSVCLPAAVCEIRFAVVKQQMEKERVIQYNLKKGERYFKVRE